MAKGVRASSSGALRLGSVVAAALIGAVLALSAVPAAAEMSAQDIKRKIESDFGVRVLKIKPINEWGRKGFAVTVMNPGGNFNEAFQVNTIVVDARTGKPIRQFRHLPSGVHEAAPIRRSVNPEAARGTP